MNETEIRALLEQIKEFAEKALRNLDRESSSAPTGKPSQRVRRRSSIDKSSPLSFQLNTLAFVKRYARRRSGPEKFAILVARLVKGSTSVKIARAELKEHWNKMKSVMGGPFNAAYANRAKANGWIDSPKHGLYVLDPSWKEILQRDNG